MGTFTVQVKIPEALRELGFSDAEICREVPMLLVVKRFREGLISSGKAAEILGISLRDFLLLGNTSPSTIRPTRTWLRTWKPPVGSVVLNHDRGG